MDLDAILEYKLIDLFKNYPLYRSIGAELPPHDRLQTLLNLRLVGRAFRDACSKWDVWWTFWNLPTRRDHGALHRFMCRLSLRYVDQHCLDSLKVLSEHHFSSRETQRLQRAASLFSFARVVQYGRLARSLYPFFGLFNQVWQEMLTLHGNAQIYYERPPEASKRIRRFHGFFNAKQKRDVLRIFRFCHMLVRRMSRHIAFTSYDCQRFTRAVQFLERAPILNL